MHVLMCTICPRPSTTRTYICTYIYIPCCNYLAVDILLIQNLYIFVQIYMYCQSICAYIYNLSEAE